MQAIQRQEASNSAKQLRRKKASHWFKYLLANQKSHKDSAKQVKG